MHSFKEPKFFKRRTPTKTSDENGNNRVSSPDTINASFSLSPVSPEFRTNTSDDSPKTPTKFPIPKLSEKEATPSKSAKKKTLKEKKKEKKKADQPKITNYFSKSLDQTIPSTRRHFGWSQLDPDLIRTARKSAKAILSPIKFDTKVQSKRKPENEIGKFKSQIQISKDSDSCDDSADTSESNSHSSEEERVSREKRKRIKKRQRARAQKNQKINNSEEDSKTGEAESGKGKLVKEMANNEELFDDIIDNDDDLLFPIPLANLSNKIPTILPLEISKQPPEMAALHLRLQEFKNKPEIRKENEDILSQAIAKRVVDEKNKKKDNSCMQMEEGLKLFNVSSEFNKFKQVIFNEVKDVEADFQNLLKLFEENIEAVLSDSILTDNCEQNNYNRIAIHLVSSARKVTNKNLHMLLYGVYLNQFNLAFSPQEDLWNDLSVQFDYFCQHNVLYVKPLSLLASLFFCIEKLTRKCKSYQEFEFDFLRLLTLFQSIFQRMSKFMKPFDTDSDISSMACLMFTLYVASALNDKDGKMQFISLAATKVSESFPSLLKLCSLKIGSTYMKFANLVSRFVNQRPTSEAITLWQDALNIVPFTKAKLHLHLFYLALTCFNPDQISSPLVKLATPIDVLAQMNRITSQLEKRKKESSKTLHHLINSLLRMLYHYMKNPSFDAKISKMILELVETVPNKVEMSPDDLMMLLDIKKMLAKLR